MLFHIVIFFYSLLFFFFLNWITQGASEPSWTFYLSTIIPLLVLSLVAAKRLSNRSIDAFLPGVVAFSAPLLLSLIDSTLEQRIFIIGASGLYYFSLLGIYRLHTSPTDQTARAMQNVAALGSLFFVYAAAYGLYLNYAVPLWLLMAVFYGATFVVSFQTLLALAPDRKSYILLVSTCLGLVFGEFIWLLHFWPFGYLTSGIATLLLYYWLWKVVFDALRGNFSQKGFLIESIVLFFLLLLLLSSSPWRMVV